MRDRASDSGEQRLARRLEIYVYLVLSFCALLLLTRWITKHVQGIGYLLTGDRQIALIIYFLVILPGVLLHEISHALVAAAVGVRVRRFSIGLRRSGRNRQVALGSVDIERTGPLLASLIGLAPLVAGCAAILLISNQVLRLHQLPPFGAPGFWQALGMLYDVPDFWLWIYLVMAVGNAMMPSAADRQTWGTAVLFFGFIGAALYFSGLLTGAYETLAQWAQNGASLLTYAFSVTSVVDLFVAVLLFLAEQGVALLGLGRIEYR